MTRKIYFKKISITNIDGQEEHVDLTKLVGNVLFNQADDVAEHDLGVKIYHEGDDGTELDEQEVKILRNFLTMFKYIVRRAIEDAIDND